MVKTYVSMFNLWNTYRQEMTNVLHQGVTAVLNFQGGVEAENWEINSKSINESCQQNNILMINYPIR